MTDAQMGLAVATPAIIVMALLLYRMGVLQKGGVTAAVLRSANRALISRAWVDHLGVRRGLGGAIAGAAA